MGKSLQTFIFHILLSDDEQSKWNHCVSNSNFYVKEIKQLRIFKYNIFRNTFFKVCFVHLKFFSPNSSQFYSASTFQRNCE